ncbi:hypothetical protein JMM63_14635 [Rhodovulum sulfidophilum]|uniref:DUF2244 domain-containing protein n=1 Tax=Rhodovulum sulfidophilum TaxID=35806 RepID=A0A0D6AZC0_RHOSU|nr:MULTISPECIES: hypothetical protein [Rhodovulum]ANB35627.1 hypothetical protein A6W98_17080 [Rhodovulum sulfidophilum DSM 1374]ANB39448.1 hypothetical protein A6024_16935 [Rhodovulum sulfidophilum]ARC89561.1 hypothetical protein B5V46_13570 [Rhodovulum sp. MB263]MBK5922788.1 hypothetical protein [Rhodovulum sulfidophilum]MBL3550897.1 hypothetical protein [Rhodovulum sulfidophilum]
MSFLRPEAVAALSRWRELIASGAVALGGLWLFGLGGYFFQALGLLALGLGLALGFVAIRRARFRIAGDGPGLVRVDEGQITYLAPQGGGFVALSEIRAIEMVFDETGARGWRLTQTRFPAVTIPASARGAEALFDVFMALPCANPRTILSALDRSPEDGPVTVWSRIVRPALT